MDSNVFRRYWISSAEKYALSKSLDAKYAGRWFSDLPDELADSIRTFRFSCEVLQGISDKEVLEIFARLNTYSVQLSNQELRNGTYFGYFKQTAYRLALEHIEFWRRHAIFSEREEFPECSRWNLRAK